MNEALDEAAMDARRIALRTNTPVVVSRNGKMVEARVTRSLKLKFPKTK